MASFDSQYASECSVWLSTGTTSGRLFLITGAERKPAALPTGYHVDLNGQMTSYGNSDLPIWLTFLKSEQSTPVISMIPIHCFKGKPELWKTFIRHSECYNFLTHCKFRDVISGYRNECDFSKKSIVWWKVTTPGMPSPIKTFQNDQSVMSENYARTKSPFRVQHPLMDFNVTEYDLYKRSSLTSKFGESSKHHPQLSEKTI